MLAVGVDGCKQVRGLLDGVVKEMGARMVRSGAVERGVAAVDVDADADMMDF
jgi:exosome complex component RRP41